VSTFSIRVLATAVAPAILLLANWLLPMYGQYGALLFYVSPWLAGLFTALIIGQEEQPRVSTAMWCASLGIVIGCVAVLATRLEGLICLIMAAPLVLLFVYGGVAMGKTYWDKKPPVPPGSPMLIFLFALGWDYASSGSEDVSEAVTSIRIQASPSRVWQEIVELSNVPSQNDWVFQTGLAAPIKCELIGTGVGARRLCTISTGYVPELITAWEPGKLLRFRALSTPPPMKELNPFGEVHAPHLQGHYRIVDGSFEIKELPNGQTELGRRTTFGNKIRPFAYWSRICGWGVERGHTVVLKELKRKAEEVATPSLALKNVHIRAKP
jgi:hypothetical protein